MSENGWPARLRRDRLTQNMSHRDLARALIATSPTFAGYSEESIERTIKRWESGVVGLPRPDAQEAIARMFGSVRAAYFPIPTAGADRALSDDEAAEVIARLRRSSIDGATLDLVRIAVDQLSIDYAHRPAQQVLTEATQWLTEIARLRRDGHLNLRQLSEIYDLAGWLSLLVACLRYDTGDDRGAEIMRRTALLLGRDLGSPDILGWGHEIAAWMALTRGDWAGVLTAVRDGLAAAHSAPVAVQLYAQAAKAWARIGNPVEVTAALTEGRELLERTPVSSNTRHHFVINPAKWDFYTMDCARRVGDDGLAWNLAETVIRESVTPGGTVISPMRRAEAELTQAAVESRAGDVDQAVEMAVAAIGRDRKSLPSLIMVAEEVAELVDGHPTGKDFRAHLADLRLSA